MSALQGEDRERLRRIARNMERSGRWFSDAAFLRDLAEHGCSGEGELWRERAEEYRDALRQIETEPVTGSPTEWVAWAREFASVVLSDLSPAQPNYGTEEKPQRRCRNCGRQPGELHGPMCVVALNEQPVLPEHCQPVETQEAEGESDG